jgi:hypothetical protein
VNCCAGCLLKARVNFNDFITENEVWSGEVEELGPVKGRFVVTPHSHPPFEINFMSDLRLQELVFHRLERSEGEPYR